MLHIHAFSFRDKPNTSTRTKNPACTPAAIKNGRECEGVFLYKLLPSLFIIRTPMDPTRPNAPYKVPLESGLATLPKIINPSIILF